MHNSFKNKIHRCTHDPAVIHVLSAARFCMMTSVVCYPWCFVSVDIWAIGCIMGELILRVPIFHAENNILSDVTKEIIAV